MEAVSMKIRAGSSFKSKQCKVCNKDAIIIMFKGEEEEIHLCIEHYTERSRNADDNKDI